MPHVSLVPFVGFRVREPEVRALGMTLPGLQPRANAISQLPALGLLTLAGMTPEAWSLSYHPAAGADDGLLDEVLQQKPDLVAVSALTASTDGAYAFCRQLRQSKVPVVIGGLHATVCPSEAEQFADAVVVGEGEPFWRRLLSDAQSGSLRRRYGPARRPSSIDWPVPRFDLLGPGKQARFTLQTQRGCPFTCEFCAASRLLGPFREKPASVVARELRALGELSRRPLIELADDNTFAGRRNVGELFDVLHRAGARYFTECDWRIGERPDVLAGLANSGCVQVLVGIESLVFRYPGMGAKQSELRRMIDAVCAIQESGVAVNGCFIVGADGETHASLDRLVQFILESPLAEVQLTLQTPFPGTALYGRLKQQGRLLAARGWSYYTLFDLTYRPDPLTVPELEGGFRRVLREVFSPQSSARRQAIRREVWKRNARLRRGGAPAYDTA